MSESEKVHINAEVPEALRKRLDDTEVAKKYGRSAAMREAIELYVAKEKECQTKA